MFLTAAPHCFFTFVRKGKRDGKPVDRWALDSHMLVFSRPPDANCVIGVFVCVLVSSGGGIFVFIVSFRKSSWKIRRKCRFMKTFGRVVDSCGIISLRSILFSSDSQCCVAVPHPQPSRSLKSPQINSQPVRHTGGLFM